MALTLEEKRDRIIKLMKTANNEDYLDLYQTLQGIKKEIVKQGLQELEVDMTEQELEDFAYNLTSIFK
jgi:flagellar motor component MotA